MVFLQTHLSLRDTIKFPQVQLSLVESGGKSSRNAGFLPPQTQHSSAGILKSTEYFCWLQESSAKPFLLGIDDEDDDKNASGED
eukprot:jgi/Psemu1/56127/gm1.56127_g